MLHDQRYNLDLSIHVGAIREEPKITATSTAFHRCINFIDGYFKWSAYTWLALAYLRGGRTVQMVIRFGAQPARNSKEPRPSFGVDAKSSLFFLRSWSKKWAAIDQGKRYQLHEGKRLKAFFSFSMFKFRRGQLFGWSSMWKVRHIKNCCHAFMLTFLQL